MKRFTKYLLICIFASFVAVTTWSCSKTNNNLEESLSTETEEENIPTESEEEEKIPSGEEYEKDEGFEKNDSENQEFEPGREGEGISEDSGSEEL